MEPVLNIPTGKDAIKIRLSDCKKVNDCKNLFIFLGVNGSGKSSLMSHLARQADENDMPFEMIRGYRAIEIDGERVTPTLYSSDDSSRAFIKQQTLEESSRYKDPIGKEATGDVLWSLFARESKFNEDLRMHVREHGNVDHEKRSPFEKINRLFLSCGIKIKIGLDNQGGIVNSKNASQYAIRCLSDGERALLLLTSQVINAPRKACIFIDEPERHLHPSVTSKLLSGLLETRSDCKFFISTHDSAILSAFSRLSAGTSIFVVHDSVWENGSPISWDIRKLDSENIPDDLANLLLGELTPVVFCEGEPQSYDIKLYSVLFPEIQFISAHNSRGVISNVRAINDLSSAGIRTPKVRGILDRDWGQRQDKDSDALPKEIVHIKVHEIESAFFVPLLIKEVINHEGLDGNLLEKIQDSFKDIFGYKETRDRLVNDYWKSQFGQVSLSSLVKDFRSADGKDGYICVPCKVSKTRSEIEGEYDRFVSKLDIFGFASVFTVKTTKFRREFANMLEFKSFDRYVNLSLSIISKNNDLRNDMIDKLGLVDLFS